MILATTSPVMDSLEQPLDGFLIHIPGAVRYACYVYKYEATREELEDMCQDVIVLLIEDNYRRLRTLDHKSLVKTWIYTIVKHYVSRRLYGCYRAISLESIELNRLACRPEQEHVVLFRERWEAIHGATSKLPEQTQVLLELFIKGYSDIEISRVIGIKADTVRKRRYNLVKRIKKLLDDTSE